MFKCSVKGRSYLLPFFSLWACISAAMFLFAGCRKPADTGEASVKAVVDKFVTRLYENFSPQQMDAMTQDSLLTLLTETEKKVLAGRYWVFDVNVPVRLSLMRHIDQEPVPFWLEPAGFKKTGLLVKNEMYTYEVWQKDFDKGEVNLGINGFDKHRPVYFISVRPLDEKDSLEIRAVFPEQQHFEKMETGAFTYHDWDGLKLTEVPADLQGEVLFTTIRGRAREAHLIKAFRDTPFPSSSRPDQITTSWRGDPLTSREVLWRTGRTVDKSALQYWKEGEDTTEIVAVPTLIEDRLLRNDRYTYRHHAGINGLLPGTQYHYRVGSDEYGWSETFSFETARPGSKDFSYIWFGDTHHSPVFGEMLKKARKRHPDAAFFQIAGDLVSTGLHRDDWDKLFAYSGNTFATKPLMSIPGNHDSQDGLGAWMYREMFSYPENGPEAVPKELTYAYNYGDALFLMIDATSPIDDQTEWIKKQLSGSKAKWKLVMFHFPPYNFVEPYPEIIEKWGPLFDAYHVDIVMGGHMHYYLRTKPMNAGKPVDDYAKGTVYMMSVSIEGKQEEWPDEPYALKRYPGGPLYQHVVIQDNLLKMVCYDPDGNIKDELSIARK